MLLFLFDHSIKTPPLEVCNKLLIGKPKSFFLDTILSTAKIQ